MPQNAASSDIGCIVESYDMPALNLRQAPYKNGVIIRELSSEYSRNDLLNQLVNSLQLQKQASNLFGIYFIKEKNDNPDQLSVVLLLRNVRKLFKGLKEYYNLQDQLCFIRMNGVLKEVINLKDTNYQLMLSKNDVKFTGKLISFDNNCNLNINLAWNIFEKIIVDKPNEIKSMVVTKSKVFMVCSSENGYTDVMRSLLLKFGTDLNLRELNESLVFVRKGFKNPSTFKYDGKISVQFNRQ